MRRKLSYSFANMQTVALEKAHAALADLVQQVADGEEFTITQNGRPKAKLSAVSKPHRAQGHAGI